MDQLLTTETLIIELLLIVSLVTMVVRRLRLPHTVALVEAPTLADAKLVDPSVAPERLAELSPSPPSVVP